MALIATRQNFYSERLSPELYDMYLRCVDSLERGMLSVSYNFSGVVDGAAIERVVEAVLCGCPELFFVDQRSEVQIVGSSVTVNFIDKYGDLDKRKAELDREIDRIAAKVRLCTGAYAKIVRIAKYLTARVEGESDEESTLGDAYGALILKKARCEGYAKAAKLIMDRVGIRSIIAVGQARQNGGAVNHAWNIAYIKDTPYAFDFSWCASGSVSGVSGVDYMFLPDKDMHIDHTPKYAYPECTDATQTYWARSNGQIKYRPDLARVKLLPSDKSFVGVVRFEDEKTAKQIKDDVPEYLAGEMYEKGASFKRIGYVYNDRLRVMTVFFINE